jgi:hypothetical protein
MRYRETFRARGLVVGVLVLGVLGGAPVAANAATLQVVPVGLGSVSVTPPATSAVSDAESPSPNCTVSGTSGPRNDLSGACTLTYAPGTTVTLLATGGTADADGPGTTFRRWSDERCPTAGACTLTVGSDAESVSALFSPQRVSVIVAGTGSVSSAPSGLSGTPAPSDCTDASSGECTGDFDPDLSGPVTLTAAGVTPTWLSADARRSVLCDSHAGAVCSVLPAWPRWVSVGFGGVDPNPAFPPEISVNFRVGKAGTGSGTVRSGSLDCGNQCAIRTTFGKSETLTAVADSGSRFDGWRAACGSAPTCSLAVGPVTSVTAVFQKGAGGGATTPGGTDTPRPRPQSRAFAARVLGLSVRGHGRRRTLSIRLRVNATATVRARLLRGRRQMASHRWRVRTGIHVLRMRVPARARPGAYRVRLSIGGPGRTVRVTRSVRLRR